MNIRKSLAAMAVAAGLAVVPAIAQSSGTGGHGARFARHQFGQRMLNHLGTTLNLNEAQKAAAQQIMTDAKAQAKALAPQMKQNRQDLQAAIKANNTGGISQAAARQGQLAGQMAEIHAKAMASFYAQLTPEQKSKLDELKQNWQSGRHNRNREHQNSKG